MAEEKRRPELQRALAHPRMQVRQKRQPVLQKLHPLRRQQKQQQPKRRQRQYRE